MAGSRRSRKPAGRHGRGEDGGEKSPDRRHEKRPAKSPGRRPGKRPDQLRGKRQEQRADRRPEKHPDSGTDHLFEAEVLPGLVPIAAAELEELDAAITASREDSIRFRYGGPRVALLELRSIVAVHEVQHFDVPRPKALLGHEHFTRLTELVARLQRGPPVQHFNGFRFGAAGSDSPVFARLAQALAQATGLGYREDGELLLRFRRAEDEGWEVLGRLTPRPLSARHWRECNLPGGLNATVAAAALDLLGSSPGDSFLNLMCGSGTLLIERGLAGQWSRGVAVDIDPHALECAERNVTAAGLAARTQLLLADATALPFEAGTFDRLCADLPWGDVVGHHRENERLYPAFLGESGRVAVTGARLLAITHEIRLFEAAVAGQGSWRRTGEPIRVFHGGHRPGLYLLERV